MGVRKDADPPTASAMTKARGLACSWPAVATAIGNIAAAVALFVTTCVMIAVHRSTAASTPTSPSPPKAEMSPSVQLLGLVTTGRPQLVHGRVVASR